MDKLVKPDYNISPATFQPIIINERKRNKIIHAKWGFIPFWAKDPKNGLKLANARSETIDIKASFKKAFKAQRCLVPASGFYEWEKTEEGSIPYAVTLKNQDFVSFAGIYEYWSNPRGGLIPTYTILTVAPNEKIKRIHDRMPVILSKNTESYWLNNSTTLKQLKELLTPYKQEETDIHRVSMAVNKPSSSGEHLIEPI